MKVQSQKYDNIVLYIISRQADINDPFATGPTWLL